MRKSHLICTIFFPYSIFFNRFEGCCHSTFSQSKSEVKRSVFMWSRFFGSPTWKASAQSFESAGYLHFQIQPRRSVSMQCLQKLGLSCLTVPPQNRSPREKWMLEWVTWDQSSRQKGRWGGNQIFWLLLSGSSDEMICSSESQPPQPWPIYWRSLLPLAPLLLFCCFN